MANRLTKRGLFTQRDIDKLLDLTDENQMGRIDAYIKLQQYEDLEEEICGDDMEENENEEAEI